MAEDLGASTAEKAVLSAVVARVSLASMWERTTTAAAVTVILALLACKSGEKDSAESKSTEPTEPSGAAPSAAPEDASATQQPEDLAPADVPEFAGCDLAAAPRALAGTWYANVGGRPVTWQASGNTITWYDNQVHRSVLRATSPCSFETDAGSLSGIFVAAGDKLYVGRSLVGRQCGDNVVACTSDGRVHVLAGTECTELTSTRNGVPTSAGPDVRRWTREPATCSLEKGAVLVVEDAEDRSLRAGKRDGVFRDVTWYATTVDSLDTGTRLVQLAKERAQADEAGPSRVKVTKGYEKLCDETGNAYACSNGAWYRCANLDKCHKSVERAELAVKKEPTHPGFLDTLAVVLCRTGKAKKADTYFERSCAAGYSANCAKKCTAEESKRKAAKKEDDTPPDASSAKSTVKSDPKRPKRRSRGK